VQNIGFTAQGNLDTAALLTFVGQESGYVQTWYDQSGFSKNLVQLVSSNQPRIVDAGVIERQNGLPAIRFVSSNASFFQTVSNIAMSGASTVNAVAQNINTTADGGSIVTHVLQSGSNGLGYQLTKGLYVPQFQFAVWRTAGGGYAAYSGSYPTSPFIATGVYGGTSISLFVNGVTYSSNASISSNISTSAPIRVGKRWDSDQYYDGYIAELILSASNLGTSDRQILELSQSTYYTIPVIASTTCCIYFFPNSPKALKN
jgi:hypothetical protein